MNIGKLTLVAGLLLLAVKPASAAVKDFDGRWIRSCGDGTFCRVYVEGKGNSRKFYFTRTSPDPNRPAECDMDVVLRYSKAQNSLTGGTVAVTLKKGKMILSGLEAFCPSLGKNAVLDRDEDADEYGDY